MNIQKIKSWRSKKYLKWVKTLDCAICGIESSSEPHHGISIGMGGMGTKAPDSAVMPLCRVCHTQVHAEPHLWPSQWQWITETLMKAIDEGVLGEK